MIELISVPFAHALTWCCNLVGSGVWGIVLFTLLSKIVLFPVSLWVQKNNISMVRITPSINRLKVKYFGDKDTVAEQTLALYKKEKYHPLGSVVPTLVQLILLLGVIGAVNRVMGTGSSSLTAQPLSLGAWGLAVPLGAGLAALALGWSQNHLNPLQKEQSTAQQWATNGFSIAISLFLGAFVSVGVALYWIVSNLLSILQQWVLNLCMPPKKYIDTADLERSKKELQALQALDKAADPENKKRERADYKRFFSVANKHIVFYSEKSGFYKYYKDVIEYLLKKSNLILHYVTNDPDDQIFTLAQAQPRIRPYYIGPTKLITLMMKMDADIVVMTCPDLNRYHLKRSLVRKDIEYVYMFHYPLSTHMVLNSGALDHYDTVFCVGDFQFAEIRAAEALYHTKPKNLISAGYGQLEQLYRGYQAMEKPQRERPKVLIAPSWQADNLLDSCLDPLMDALLDQGFELVVRPHPEYVKRYGPRMDAIVARYRDKDVGFELDFTSNSSIFDSDLLITDWSGTAYEFSFVTLKPAVFIDTPPKIHNPDWDKLGIEPLEFSLRDKVGIRVDPENMADLAQRLRDLLQEESYSQRILQIRESTISHFGQSGKVGGKYLLGQLVARQQNQTKGE